MWDLAMEILGVGEPVPYEPLRAGIHRPGAGTVRSLAPNGNAWPSCWPGPDTLRTTGESLLAAVDAWRRAHAVPMASIKPLGAAVIAWFDQLTASNVLPHLPAALQSVPRANIRFLPIKDAWFSGSMNYLGRARKRRWRAGVRGHL